MSEVFKGVARLDIDVAYESEEELESFFDAMVELNKNKEFKVKVVGDYFDPQDKSEIYKSHLIPCTCNSSLQQRNCPRHGTNAYA